MSANNNEKTLLTLGFGGSSIIIAARHTLDSHSPVVPFVKKLKLMMTLVKTPKKSDNMRNLNNTDVQFYK